MTQSARTASREERRGKVLAAAVGVFLEHGFSAATTDMIQKAAGVSKATMYAFFPSKENLFNEVVKHECAAMLATFDFMHPKAEKVDEALGRLGRRYLEFVISPVALALYRVTVAEAVRFPELGRLFYQNGPLVAKVKVKAYLIAAADAGELDLNAVGADGAASIFLSMVRGEAHLECMTQPAFRPTEAQMNLWVENAVTTFMRAYGAKCGH